MPKERKKFSCAGPERFLRGGPTLTSFFFLLLFFFSGGEVFFKLMRGERIQIPLIAGNYRPTSETPFK